MTNQYTYRLPFTEEELFRDYTVLRMTQYEIAAKYGTTQKVVWRAMTKMGVKARKAAKRDQRRSRNTSWKGGRILCATRRRQPGERTSFGNGYYYLLMPTHPNADKRGYVAEHIFVATKERQRPLDTGEHVHHINLDKHDNSPSNLIIGTGTDHSRWHAQLEVVAASFLRDGLIRFDPRRGYIRA